MIMEPDKGGFPLIFVICQTLRRTRQRCIISAVAHLEHQIRGQKSAVIICDCPTITKNTCNNAQLCLCHIWALLIRDLMLIVQIR